MRLTGVRDNFATPGPMTNVFRLADYRLKHRRTFFTRPELHQLLQIYSRQVARGQWRDYAIDQQDGAVLFSVFRHTQESPLFTVVKAAPGQGKDDAFALLQGRQRIAGGARLGDVLTSLTRALGPLPVSYEGESAS